MYLCCSYHFPMVREEAGWMRVVLPCPEKLGHSFLLRSSSWQCVPQWKCECLGNYYFIFLLHRAIIAPLLEWFKLQRSSSVGSNGRSLMASLYFPIFCVCWDPWCSLEGLSYNEGCYSFPFGRQAGEGDGATCLGALSSRNAFTL